VRAVTDKFTKAAKFNSRDQYYFTFYIIYIIIFSVHKSRLEISVLQKCSFIW